VDQSEDEKDNQHHHAVAQCPEKGIFMDLQSQYAVNAYA
jgi:hypothetical protein